MRLSVFRRTFAKPYCCFGARTWVLRGSGAAAAVMLLFLAASRGAQAQVTFSLTPADETYTTSASAQTVDYYGTISNLGSTTIYLNAIDIDVDPAFSSSVTPNTSLFYDNVPATLSAFGVEGSSYSGIVFGIDLGATNVTAPSYSGGATIEGGTTDSSLGTLGTLQEFLGMPASSSAMPEPIALILLTCGGLGTSGLAAVRRRIRQNRRMFRYSPNLLPVILDRSKESHLLERLTSRRRKIVAACFTCACAATLPFAAATRAPAQVRAQGQAGVNPIGGAPVIVLTDAQILAQQMRVSTAVAQQILNLADDKAARTPAQKKISSDFIYAARMAQGLPAATGVPTLLTSLNPDAQGRVLAEFHTRSAPTGAAGQGLHGAIVAAGGTVVVDAGSTIVANVPLLQIEPLAARGDVAVITKYYPPQYIGSHDAADRMRAIHSRALVPFSEAHRKEELATRVAKAKAAFIGSRLNPDHDMAGRASAVLRGLLLNDIDYDGMTNTGTIGEGVAVHNMASTFAAYAVNGAGLRIGVLSDGDANLAASQAASDLPPTDSTGTSTTTSSVTVAVDDTQSPPVSLDGDPGNTGEGTAMMEIVHDMAPGAKIFFATTGGTTTQLATYILLLRFKYNCDIIVDDVINTDEAVFSDDDVAQSVNQVTNSGGLYFSSAGNYGHISKFSAPNPPFANDPSFAASTWEGDFVLGGSGTSFGGTTPAGNVNIFNNGVQDPYVPESFGNPYNLVDTPRNFNGSGLIVLNWSDKTSGGTAANPTVVTGATNDYDLYVTSADGTTLVSSGTSTQDGQAGQAPIESASIQANDRVYILKNTSASPCALHLTTFGSYYYDSPSLALTTNGNIFGHAAASQAFAVAASPATTVSPLYFGPYPNAFNSANVSDYFTSDGPRAVFWNVTGGPNLTFQVTPTVAANGYTLPTSIPVFTQIGTDLLFATNGSSASRLKPELTAADGVHSGTAFSSGSGLNPFRGTSAAAPHAAAIAAVVKSYSGVNGSGTTVNGTLLSVSEMRTVLTSTAIDIESAGFDVTTGYGIVMPTPVIAFLLSFCNTGSVSVYSTTQTTATINWTTNLPASSIVNYDLATDNSFSTVVNSTPTTSHSITITGLTPGTAYRYRVSSVTPTVSVRFDDPADRSFATVPSSTPVGTPKIAVTGISLTTGGASATVTLTNNGTGAATNVRITSATLNSAGTTSTVPVPVGSIAAGASAQATLTFPAQTSGSRTVLTIAGTDGSGATFTSSARVTIP